MLRAAQTNEQAEIISSSKEYITVDSLTEAWGVPRNVFASNDQIHRAWEGLKHLLPHIPTEYGGAHLARLCMAVNSGLFDCAINYAWNMTILSLRGKIINFGIAPAAHLVSKINDENSLNELQDSELLKYCLQLNLISEEGYFFLEQCRDTRNNFSAAHPITSSIEVIDDFELMAFINRCTKFAFDSSKDPKGLDIKLFLAALKAGKYTDQQSEHWGDLIRATNMEQREFIYTTLHGMYCDPESTEETRLNCLFLCQHTTQSITPRVTAKLITQHLEYKGSGQTERQQASLTFFRKLELLSELDHTDQHALFNSACNSLLVTHHGMNNFYNEPPQAERLLEISKQIATPKSIQPIFVETVITCAVGNEYGVSRIALPYYKELIKGFSQNEIAYMVELSNTETNVSHRIHNHSQCKERYIGLLGLLDEESIPRKYKQAYEDRLNGRF